MPRVLTREDDARFDALKASQKALMDRINARRKAKGQRPLAEIRRTRESRETARNASRELAERGRRETIRGRADVLTREAERRATDDVVRLSRDARNANRERIVGRATDDLVEQLTRDMRNSSALGLLEQREFNRRFVARVASREYKGYANAFQAWFRSGDQTGVRAAMGGYRNMRVRNGLHTEDNQSGGFLVPEEIEYTIDRILYDLSIMRQIATVRPATAATLKKFFNMAGTTTGWVGERETRVETNTPEIKELDYPIMELYAEPQITQVMLEDAGFSVEAWLAEEVQIAFSEAESEAFINGDGNKKPWGLIGGYDKVADATFKADVPANFGKWGYVATGAASSFPTANPGDVLIDLRHSLRPQNRASAVWTMNDLTAATVSKFKDGEGNYLWRQSIADDHDGTLLGKNVMMDEIMPDIGAGTFPIAFGDFAKAYLILDRAGMTTLRDDLTKKGWVKFYTRKRVMGGAYNFEALKLLKVATS